MDLVKACRAFVGVADLGSFTEGAALARTSQSAASRSIAALEAELGAPLFDRGARRVGLTVFGRRMLPIATSLVDIADSLGHRARVERSSPVRLAVPENCDVRDLAALQLAGRDAGLSVVLLPAAPNVRANLLASDHVDASLHPCGDDQATWVVPLGLAGALASSVVSDVGELRPDRLSDRDHHRAVWLVPEDDVPHLRDRLLRHAEAVGLLVSQIRVASSPAAALAAVLGSTDLMLASRSEAESMDLAWSRLAEPDLRRGHALTPGRGGVMAHLDEIDAGAVAACLRLDTW